ncbi:hypothetical protein OEA41_009265 [Lepraria neglecta]|uniref:Uncharacterized protein n=1 Tax=Lepraria neglecta TaxID=209136 RepID=A0AAD9Z2V3_9LECA|nr:hypothetical protein OEA41_009265 [Lepraria neglecta]
MKREFFPPQTSPEPDDGHGNDEFGRIMDLLDADWDGQALAERDVLTSVSFTDALYALVFVSLH